MVTTCGSVHSAGLFVRCWAATPSTSTSESRSTYDTTTCSSPGVAAKVAGPPSHATSPIPGVSVARSKGTPTLPKNNTASSRPTIAVTAGMELVVGVSRLMRSVHAPPSHTRRRTAFTAAALDCRAKSTTARPWPAPTPKLWMLSSVSTSKGVPQVWAAAGTAGKKASAQAATTMTRFIRHLIAAIAPAHLARLSKRALFRVSRS